MQARGLRTVLVALALVGCGPRHGRNDVAHPLGPPPPPPPGSTTVWGPLAIESVTAARSDVGWDRDFVRGSRVVAFDVVVVQERATCPQDAVAAQLSTDGEGCKGLTHMPAACKVEPKLRARVEVTVVHGIDVAHRCAGDANPYVVESDPRSSLTLAGKTCFKNRNKLKPESAWTSLYELTELKFGEKIETASTLHPRLLAKLLAGDAARFCRDDGAYLDGTPGRPLVDGEKIDLVELAQQLVARASTSAPSEGGVVPLTGADFQTEHALWERCNANDAKGSVAAQQRCLLLRQLDRFLRDVEDLARPETPKGMGGGP